MFCLLACYVTCPLKQSPYSTFWTWIESHKKLLRKVSESYRGWIERWCIKAGLGFGSAWGRWKIAAIALICVWFLDKLKSTVCRGRKGRDRAKAIRKSQAQEGMSGGTPRNTRRWRLSKSIRIHSWMSKGNELSLVPSLYGPAFSRIGGLEKHWHLRDLNIDLICDYSRFIGMVRWWT